MKALGCLGLLAVALWLVLESWAYIVTARFLNHEFGEQIGAGGWWLPALWIIAGIVIGARIAKHHIAKVVPALLTGQAGRHVVGALGGVLLALPGLLSDIPGLVLLLPPVQAALGKLGNAIVASVVKRTMGRMFGGGGMPLGGGLFGKAGASPFPGMMPRADDRAAFPTAAKGRKTYDTVAERD